MKRPLFIQNTSIDEKRISFIERVVSRLAIRARKSSIAIMPSIPISAYMSGENLSGCVLRHMLFKGKIVKGAVRFGTKPKNDVCIDVRIVNEEIGRAGITGTIYTNRQRAVSDFDIDTSNGSLLEVSITPADEDVIKEIWLGILWVPHVRNSRVKKYLIDKLEKESDDLLEEE